MGMRYDNMKKRIKRKVTVHDGYNGNTEQVGVAFYDGKAYFVAKSGYFRANGKIYETEQDMLNDLDNNTADFAKLVEGEPVEKV